MKFKKSEIAAGLKEVLTEKQAAGTAYQLRTECRYDCEHIRAILGPWLVSWKETSGYKTDDSYVGEDGVIWASMNWGADTDVQFIIGEGGPGLNETRWFLDKLTDCHVAAESLNTREQYTGERIHFEVFNTLKSRPTNAMINKAMGALAQRKKLSECSILTADDAWNSLSDGHPMTN